MKLSKIYSNHENEFSAIRFNDGLNVILAEIRLPENRKKDTHNLGKTTLSKLIDYCLLKGKHKDFFLFKHEDVFEPFIFFLEIKLKDAEYLTIRRSVTNSSKISFKKHKEPYQNFTSLTSNKWDHDDVAFDKARQILDGLLELTTISPWTYRTALGYSLRVQKDYLDVFKLDKFKGRHLDWKPYLAKILGFNDSLCSCNYELTEEIGSKTEQLNILKKELIGVADDLDKLDGLILIKSDEIDKLEAAVSRYDFKVTEAEINQQLVTSLETQIAGLNEQRYYITSTMEQIQEALKEKIIFNVESANAIFKEAKIYFGEQLKKEFNDLIEFNKTITEERQQYLKEEAQQLTVDIESIEKKLSNLNAQRSKALSILKEKKSFVKYKKITNKIVELKADLESLQRQKQAAQKLRKIEKEISKMNVEKDTIKDKIKDNIEEQNKTYKNIRIYFSKIIKRVLDRAAVISTTVNDHGNLDYKAGILDDSGKMTSQALGHTYKKLLCIAFDLAVLREHSQGNFINFVYHDGIFESLDNRKKMNLIEVMREYSRYNIQHIVTAIDSDLPIDMNGNRFQFEPAEVIKILHDENKSGRLFNISTW